MIQKLKKNATVFEALNWASLRLKEKNLDSDQGRWLMRSLMGWNLTNLLMNYRLNLTDDQQSQFIQMVNRILNYEPLQYVIGTTEFYGYPFQVNPNVLIPRPETEELVEWVLNEHDDQPISVLDLGTGSGAIAISLKKQRPKWNVTGSDVSEAALKVAQANAIANHAEVKMVESDLFDAFNGQRFDLIVSNPPYVAKDEIKYMDESVLEYEPRQALFAQDHGLAIYQKIAKNIHAYLKQNGSLYLEIGFKQGNSVKRLLEADNPDRSVRLRKDMAMRDRMIKMNKENE